MSLTRRDETRFLMFDFVFYPYLPFYFLLWSFQLAFCNSIRFFLLPFESGSSSTQPRSRDPTAYR
jgi:hypothetical protein